MAVERSRLDPDARRAQLIELGAEMLASRPVDQFIVDEIAAAAGISRGLLFHYFKSKRDFVAAVAETVAEQFFDATAPDPNLPIEGQLHQSLDQYLRYIEDHQTAYLSLIRGTLGGDDALAEVTEATRRRIVERVLEGAGITDPTPKLRIAVRGWVALCEEVSIEWLPSRTIARADIIALLEQTLIRIIELAA
jgi:AcrR family transcriptional regulator